MKATAWLCPVVTLLCATKLVCTAQGAAGGGGGRDYPLDYYAYADANMIQNDNWMEKRNKPSLSIVNPLDVLRQRLLLEIARRQMKENTRQVELNRAILKNVGKRFSAAHYYRPPHRLTLQHFHHPTPDYFANQQLVDDYVPMPSIFDYLQRPVYDVNGNGNMNGVGNGGADIEDDGKKFLDSTGYQLKVNEIGNERMSENLRGPNADADGTDNHKAKDVNVNVSVNHDDNRSPARGNDNGRGGVDGGAGDAGDGTANHDNDDDNVADYRMRYLYRLHKNNFAQKK